MPIDQALVWFTLGFTVAAVALYGPMMTKAIILKMRAAEQLKEALQKLQKSTEQVTQCVEANEETLKALKDLNALGTEHAALQKTYGELLEKHIELLKTIK